MFEQSQSFRTLLIHTQGAIALLELRGKDQFRRQAGLRMFHAVRSEFVRQNLRGKAASVLTMVCSFSAAFREEKDYPIL